MREHNPFDWIRGILVGILLGAAGLIATPVGILLVGALLRPFEKDVAQGYYSGLSIFGLIVAPLGAIYWLAGGILLGAGFVRDTERRFRPWLITLAIYGALIGGFAALIALFA